MIKKKPTQAQMMMINTITKINHIGNFFFFSGAAIGSGPVGTWPEYDGIGAITGTGAGVRAGTGTGAGVGAGLFTGIMVRGIWAEEIIVAFGSITASYNNTILAPNETVSPGLSTCEPATRCPFMNVPFVEPRSWIA
jgi:hypothetical protein